MNESNSSNYGSLKLTPEIIENLKDVIHKRIETELPYYQKICDALTEGQRLAVTAWVMRHICDHAREGGTFRYLIYDRMGFGPKAYLPLQLAGGLEISNEFNLSEKQTCYLLVGDPPNNLPSQHLIRKYDAIRHVQSIPEFKDLNNEEAECQFQILYMTKPVEVSG